MIEVGRLCVKIAGRDSRQRCVIIDILDKDMVLIDGQTRRRKCNVAHLEPLEEVLTVARNAPHEEVVRAFKDLHIDIQEKKPRQKTDRPKKQRSGKKEPVATEKPKKTSVKKS